MTTQSTQIVKKAGTALLTGASAGIGRDLARLFARDGFNLILVARTAERLEAYARELSGEYGIQARGIPLDLSEPGAARRLVDQLSDRELPLDALVNNAGFGSHGRFDQIPMETHHRMMQLNMVVLTELTQLVLPGMIQRGRGRILNVASTAAFQPGPWLAVYYATKAYVLSFSEALSNELCGTGVTVTALCPGPTQTEFQERAGIAGLRLLKSPAVMQSLPVAVRGYRALMKGKRLEVPGALNKLMAFSTRLAPRFVVTGIVAKLQER